MPEHTRRGQTGCLGRLPRRRLPPQESAFIISYLSDYPCLRLLSSRSSASANQGSPCCLFQPCPFPSHSRQIPPHKVKRRIRLNPGPWAPEARAARSVREGTCRPHARTRSQCCAPCQRRKLQTPEQWRHPWRTARSIPGPHSSAGAAGPERRRRRRPALPTPSQSSSTAARSGGRGQLSTRTARAIGSSPYPAPESNGLHLRCCERKTSFIVGQRARRAFHGTNPYHLAARKGI